MHICRIEVQNFRNFHHLVLEVGEHAVIVGENKIGKSNLVYALRLVLDPKISDSDRQLRMDDFWDGLPSPRTKNDFIHISVDITDFEDNEDLMAVLAEHLVQAEPMVSRLTYLYRPIPGLKKPPQKEADYEFVVYGGDRPENRIGYETRQCIPLTLLPALRNAEEDLANWRQSPLAPLLRAVSASMDRAKLEKAVEKVSAATKSVANLSEIKSLADQIQESLRNSVGDGHAVATSLGFSPTDPDRLLRSLRLYIDNNTRTIADASLGTANLMYLTLLSLELQRQVAAGERSHTFLAIEEPEAHLHPHLQRLVYREFLSARDTEKAGAPSKKAETILLTTHSPHVVSVAPLKSIVLLRRSDSENSTIGVSTAKLNLEEKTIQDIERYLDVNRGEMVFAKGILLVEGPAEEFILPSLSKLLNINFDQLGITVCSVDGTNFAPYVQFLGVKGLNIPWAVITDMDPQSPRKALGVARANALLKQLDAKYNDKEMNREKVVRSAKKKGIFLNSYTLEVDLFQSGHHVVMCEVLSEMTANGAAKARAVEWKANPDKFEPKRFLADIEEIGKGRYAQRLASSLRLKRCPAYIQGAIKYVTNNIK